MSSPSFTHTFPIKINSIFEEHILDKKLNISRMFYNKMLQETLLRYERIIYSDEYQEGIRLYKTKKDENIQKAYLLFNKAKKDAEFSEYELHSFATHYKNTTFFLDHLGSDLPQVLATKAFKTVSKYLYRQSGKPRFKTKNMISSIQGKSQKSELQFKNGKLILAKSKTVNKKRKSFQFDIIYDHKDPYGVEAHALNSKVKYVRILKKFSAGKFRYYMQLVLEGNPLQKSKNVIKQGKVGVDLGPSIVAIVSERASMLEQLNSEILSNEKKKKAAQRKMERSRRKTNPKNYEEDFYVKKDKKVKKKKGKIKKGKLKWTYSKAYYEARKEVLNYHSKAVASRKKAMGEIINKILSLGNEIYTEKISLKAWQKMFGKSILNSAPGEFLEILSRKAENAGGSVNKISTYTTKLSQACICGKLERVSLNVRWKTCECGVIDIQRDLFSAYLALFVEEINYVDTLDVLKAQEAFAGAENHLRKTASAAIKAVKAPNMRHLSYALAK